MCTTTVTINSHLNESCSPEKKYTTLIVLVLEINMSQPNLYPFLMNLIFDMNDLHLMPIT